MNTTLGKRISFHRKRLGMTQEQLAERMNVSAQAVSKWENDQSCPDISLLPKLAELFGVTVDELLGGPTQDVHVAEPISERSEKEQDGALHISFGGAKKRMLSSTLWFAGYLLLVGGLLLAAYFLQIDISWWTVVWTSAGFVFGLSWFFDQWSIGGLLIALAGAYFELSAFGVIHFDLGWDVVLPILLIALAVSIVLDQLVFKRLRTEREKKHEKMSRISYRVNCENGMLDCEMTFGDARANVETECLKGGRIETGFGDFVVDFSKTQSVAPECKLDLEASFGNLTLLVPQRYRVTLKEEGAFSAAHTEGAPSDVTEGTIEITAEVSFGALEIKYI